MDNNYRKREWLFLWDVMVLSWGDDSISSSTYQKNREQAEDLFWVLFNRDMEYLYEIGYGVTR